MDPTPPESSQAIIDNAQAEVLEQLKQLGISKAKSVDKDFKSSNEGLEKQHKDVLKEQKNFDKLKNLKDGIIEIAHHGNTAGEVALSISTADVITKITEAAKSTKNALKSIEVTYPEAEAMKARVHSVEVEKDTNVIDLVEAYVTNSKLAADTTEKSKNYAQKTAIASTKSLNKKVDLKLAEITELNANIQTINQEIEALCQLQQKSIADAEKKYSSLKTAHEAISLEKLKSDLEFNSLKAYADLNNENPTKKKGK